MSAHTASGSLFAPKHHWRVREADGEADAFFINRQWHHYFGAKYDSQKTLQHDLFAIAGWGFNDQTPEDAFGLIAEHSGKQQSVRIGAGLATIVDHQTAVDELPDGRYDPDSLAAEKNAWLRLSVVDPAWRGRGIGHRLFKRRLEWASNQDAQIILGFGWERDAGASSRPLFEAFDFHPIQQYPEYYARIDARRSCPDCRSWPSNDRECRCGATLWALELSSDHTP